MKTRNKVFLRGFVGNDPEVRVTSSGLTVVTLSLATNFQTRDGDGGWQTGTEWHRLVAFGKAAELIADMVQKGDDLDVEGRIRTRKVENDDSVKYYTDIVINEFYLASRRNRVNEETSVEDDLPF